MRVAAVVAIAHLVSPGHEVVSPPAHPLQAAVAAAKEFWHDDPCSGSVTISYSSTVPANVDTGGVPISVAAWTTFTVPPGASRTAFRAYEDCVITINSSTFPSRQVERADFAFFCPLIVHEFGHLEGHGDSAADSPASVTYPIVSQRNLDVGPCVRRYLRIRRRLRRLVTAGLATGAAAPTRIG